MVVKFPRLSPVPISAGKAHGVSMPLSSRLADLVLSRPCPHCGYVLHMKGRWFQRLSLYKCAYCQKQVQMTYEAKVELFEKYQLPEAALKTPGH